MSVHLMLSAGRGPRECAWALARLLRRLESEATRRHLTIRRMRTVAGDRPGTYRSAVIAVSGPGAEGFAASWTGTLCWQAPSPYRTGTGRKNWFVTAALCDLASARTPFHDTDVEIVACRTGGPGGQHRDKASTAARATHRPTGIVVVVDTERQFSRNRALALQRLRQRIEQAVRAADQATTTARWRVHDQLVRGDPTRVERPNVTEQEEPGTARLRANRPRRGPARTSPGWLTSQDPDRSARHSRADSAGKRRRYWPG